MKLQWFSFLDDSEMTCLWACLQVRPEGVLEVFQRSFGEFEKYFWCLRRVYGAKHSPSSSCFCGPSGWFWGFFWKMQWFLSNTFDFCNLRFCCKLRWRGVFQTCFKMMQIWSRNDFRVPKIVKWLVFEHVCRLSRRVFWRSSKDPLESSRNIFGVWGEYMVRSTLLRPLVFVALRADSGAFSGKCNDFFRTHLIFAIWASVANWDEEVCVLKLVLKWCKYEVAMIFASQRELNDLSLSMSAGSSRGCSGGLPKILWRGREIFLVSEESMWCEALSFVLLFLWPFGLILGLFLENAIISFEHIWFLQSEVLLQTEMKRCVSNLF